MGLAQPPDTGTITVAWADSTTGYWWNDGDRGLRPTFNGEAVDVEIAPDTQSIAFLERVDGFPNTLWQSDFVGISPLVNADTHLDGASVGQFAWVDGMTLYFNTVRFDTPLGGIPQNDLWRMALDEMEPEQLLEPGAGGAFSVSPDGQTIAVTQPGMLTAQGTPDTEGAILFYDVATGEMTLELGFLPVATASPSPYYPRVAWSPEGATLNVAIPPQSIVYGDDAATLLWQIPREGVAEQVGAVPASFFHPIRWNADRTRIFYAAETDNPNAFDLVIANADGSNPTTLATGAFAFLWAGAEDRFLWAVEGDDAPTYYIGDLADPRRYTFDAPVFNPVWADGSRLVFVTSDDDGLTMNLGTLNEGGTDLTITPLGPLTEPPIALDAVATDGG